MRARREAISVSAVSHDASPVLAQREHPVYRTPFEACFVPVTLKSRTHRSQTCFAILASPQPPPIASRLPDRGSRCPNHVARRRPTYRDCTRQGGDGPFRLDTDIPQQRATDAERPVADQRLTKETRERSVATKSARNAVDAADVRAIEETPAASVADQETTIGLTYHEQRVASAVLGAANAKVYRTGKSSIWQTRRPARTRDW